MSLLTRVGLTLNGDEMLYSRLLMSKNCHSKNSNIAVLILDNEYEIETRV
jgi:hypothetical protein